MRQRPQSGEGNKQHILFVIGTLTTELLGHRGGSEAHRTGCLLLWGDHRAGLPQRLKAGGLSELGCTTHLLCHFSHRSYMNGGLKRGKEDS